MTSVIAHRGPDDHGHFIDGPVGLGFRRLSILDLSENGHQPMQSDDGSLWIIFNGEIYNYIELRDELKSFGFRFRTGTDTEVILAAYRQWGKDCLSRFNGMWAIALWDTARRELFCARDRFGVKPFYYYRDDRRLIFASEIKAILTQGVPREPHVPSIFTFLVESQRDWDEHTFFKGIYHLLPGHYMVVSETGTTIRRYYELSTRILEKRTDDVEEFRRLFTDSVRLRLRSDVPVGTCLSGGLDSSAIACTINQLMKADRVSTTPIGERQKTFSACTDYEPVDERPYMQTVIDATGAEQNFVFPSADDLTAHLDHVIWTHEEPFPSTSMYAQYCVMRIAKNRGIKVLLDGQGSDEILGGYNAAYFPYFASLLRSGRWGRFIRTVAHHRLNGKRMTPGAWMTVFLSCFPSAGSAIRNRLILRLDNGLSDDFVNSVRGSDRHLLGVESSLTRHLVKDMNRILRSLLMYEDKNSMAFSIEARVPFLDYRLVEFLFRLPDERKIDRGLRKVILREAMRGTVPDKILDRRDKIGFATEQDRWFQRGSLREAMRDVFHSAGFRSRGYFDAPAICKAFDVLPTGEGKKTYFNFWACFHLEMWFRRFIDAPIR